MDQTVRVVQSSPALWFAIPHLTKKMEEVSLGRFLQEDMYEMIVRGVFQFWTIWDNDPKITGAILTEIARYPRRTVLTIPFAAGVGLKQWPVAAEVLEDFGRKRGCQELEGWGKKGWGKVLDWEVPYYRLRKVL